MFLAEYSYEEDISAQREEAFEDGFEKGKITGLNKGIQQGIQQGIIDTAKKMLENNLPLESIAKYTGLSINEIENII